MSLLTDIIISKTRGLRWSLKAFIIHVYTKLSFDNLGLFNLILSDVRIFVGASIRHERVFLNLSWLGSLLYTNHLYYLPICDFRCHKRLNTLTTHMRAIRCQHRALSFFLAWPKITHFKLTLASGVHSFLLFESCWVQQIKSTSLFTIGAATNCLKIQTIVSSKTAVFCLTLRCISLLYHIDVITQTIINLRVIRSFLTATWSYTESLRLKSIILIIFWNLHNILLQHVVLGLIHGSCKLHGSILVASCLLWNI